MTDWGLPTEAELQGVWLALERTSRTRDESGWLAPLEPSDALDAHWRLGWE